VALLGLLAFLLLPAGAIALIYLIVKALQGAPAPSTDPTLPTPSTTGRRVAWALVIAGAVSFVIIWVLGSAMAIQ
jgi:hypothetical protein